MTARAAAATLMILSGTAILALSVGGAWYATAHPAWIEAQLADVSPDVREQLDVYLSRDVILQLTAVCGLVGAAEGAFSVLLGWLVARGGRWALRTAIAATASRLLLVGLLVAVLFFAASLGPLPPVDLRTVAALAVVALVLLATLVLLIKSPAKVPPALPRSR